MNPSSSSLNPSHPPPPPPPHPHHPPLPHQQQQQHHHHHHQPHHPPLPFQQPHPHRHPPHQYPYQYQYQQHSHQHPHPHPHPHQHQHPHHRPYHSKNTSSFSNGPFPFQQNAINHKPSMIPPFQYPSYLLPSSQPNLPSPHLFPTSSHPSIHSPAFPHHPNLQHPPFNQRGSVPTFPTTSATYFRPTSSFAPPHSHLPLPLSSPTHAAAAAAASSSSHYPQPGLSLSSPPPLAVPPHLSTIPSLPFPASGFQGHVTTPPTSTTHPVTGLSSLEGSSSSSSSTSSTSSVSPLTTKLTTSSGSMIPGSTCFSFPTPKVVVQGFNQEALSKMSKLFIGNISVGIEDEWMEQILNVWGTLEEWKRARGSDGNVKGFGFATFSNPEVVILLLKILGEDPSTSLELPSVDQSPWKRLLLKVDESSRKLLEEYKTARGHHKGDFEREKAAETFIYDLVNKLKASAPPNPTPPPSITTTTTTTITPSTTASSLNVVAHEQGASQPVSSSTPSTSSTTTLTTLSTSSSTPSPSPSISTSVSSTQPFIPSTPSSVFLRPKRWDQPSKPHPPSTLAIRLPKKQTTFSHRGKGSKRLFDEDTLNEEDGGGSTLDGWEPSTVLASLSSPSSGSVPDVPRTKKSRMMKLPQVPTDLTTILETSIQWSHFTDASIEVIQWVVLQSVNMFLGVPDDDLSEYIMLRILKKDASASLLIESLKGLGSTFQTPSTLH
ncbi:hypothetical protein HMI54_015194, partial [Coelomomyces lativittatus]